MLNKLFKIAFFIFLFSLLFNISYAGNINVEITLKDKKNETLIKDKVIIVSGVGDNSKYLVSSTNGNISFSVPYSEEGTDIILNINSNFLYLKNVQKQNNKGIIVYYNTKEEEIKGVDYNGKYEIDNQIILKLTNYPVLLLFFFFTFTIVSILLLGRIGYMYSGKDIYQHKK